jgi:hypothetical protein
LWQFLLLKYSFYKEDYMALGEMNSGNKTLPEWSEVQNKPSEFNPATHIHNDLYPEGDNRNDNTSPSDYYGVDRNDYNGRLIFRGLKLSDKIGLSSGHSCAFLIGLSSWYDDTGGGSFEFAFSNGNIYYRQGTTS